METFEMNGVIVNTIGISDKKEIEAYVDHAARKYGESLREVTIRPDPQDESFVSIACKVDEPFERIRRITGYLVGTLDSFNDAKKAEEHDRVKHSV